MLHTRLPGVDMKPQAANDAKNESYSGAKSPCLQNDSPAPGFGAPEYYSALVATHILSSRSAPTTAVKHKQLINTLVLLRNERDAYFAGTRASVERSLREAHYVAITIVSGTKPGGSTL